MLTFSKSLTIAVVISCIASISLPANNNNQHPSELTLPYEQEQLIIQTCENQETFNHDFLKIIGSTFLACTSYYGATNAHSYMRLPSESETSNFLSGMASDFICQKAPYFLLYSIFIACICRIGNWPKLDFSHTVGALSANFIFLFVYDTYNPNPYYYPPNALIMALQSLIIGGLIAERYLKYKELTDDKVVAS